MTELQKKIIRSYPSADCLLKHKDAVTLCVQFLISEGVEVDTNYLDTICQFYENRCYIGSKNWLGKEKNK